MFNRDLALGVLAALVQRGIAIPWAAVQRGFELARWPGRFERSPRSRVCGGMARTTFKA